MNWWSFMVPHDPSARCAWLSRDRVGCLMVKDHIIWVLLALLLYIFILIPYSLLRFMKLDNRLKKQNILYNIPLFIRIEVFVTKNSFPSTPVALIIHIPPKSLHIPLPASIFLPDPCLHSVSWLLLPRNGIRPKMLTPTSPSSNSQPY